MGQSASAVASWMNRNGAAEIARAYTESRRLRFRLIGPTPAESSALVENSREPRRIWRFLTAGGIALAASSAGLAVVSSTLAEADQTGSLNDVYSIAISPNGARVYAGQGLGGPYIALSRDASSGKLTYLSPPIFPGSGAGASGIFQHSIVVGHDNNAVYDTENGLNAVRQMSVTSNSLSYAATYTDFTGGITNMEQPVEIAESPDGSCLYVTNQGTNRTVTEFSVNSDDSLSFAGSYSLGTNANVAAEIAFAPGGGMYAASYTFILNFQRSGCTITGSTTTGVSSSEVQSIALSPDGTSLYAVDTQNSRIFTFSRNTTTGVLTQAQTLTENVGGVTGLTGVDDVVVSPDGKNVYTTAYQENAIAEFSRDTGTGQLSETGILSAGSNGITSLTKAETLVISPDGADVYVGSSSPSNSVTAFSRDSTSGVLSYLQTITQADAPSPTTTTTAPTLTTSPSSGGGSGVTTTTAPKSTSPTPPPGIAGVSIAGGDFAIDSPSTELDLVWPRGATSALISNDGGFGAAGGTQTVALSNHVPWRLQTTGPGRLTKTVYVRYLGAGIDLTTFTDDIVLDEQAPSVVSATLLGTTFQATPKLATPHSQKKASARMLTYRLAIRATEKISGVSAIQASTKKAGGTIVTLRSSRQKGFVALDRTVNLRATVAPRYVRVDSAAGRWSKWVAITAQ